MLPNILDLLTRRRADEALRADHLASPSWSPSMGAVIKGNICIIYAAKNH